MGNHFLLFIGGPEIVVIVLVIVMFFGSKKIPEIARGLGQGIRELKNATDDIQREIIDSTKDIKKVKDSVNVEKQMKDFVKNKVEENKKSNEPENEVEKEEIIAKNPENSVSRSKSTSQISPEENSTT